MADSHNQAETKRDYPVTEGLIAGSTKTEGKKTNLVPTGLHGCKTTARYSNVNKRDKVGLD